MPARIEDFRLPRYREIPNVGLYLDQTVKYINSYLAPLGNMEITASMVSNYVKKGYIRNPVRKQYSAEQIAYLMAMAVVKNVVPMENIALMFDMQKRSSCASALRVFTPMVSLPLVTMPYALCA